MSPFPPVCPVCPVPLTCVEDAGGQWGRRGLVQDQLPDHHPGGVPGKPALEEAHPEEVEVAMETERHHGDVARMSPVHRVPAREPLVDKVPAGEQTTVQGDVSDPREPADLTQKRPAHRVTAAVTLLYICTVLAYL